MQYWTDSFGTWHIHAQGLPDDGAKVMAAIRAFADEAFKAARAQGLQHAVGTIYSRDRRLRRFDGIRAHDRITD
jgi:hypothetical protein